MSTNVLERLRSLEHEKHSLLEQAKEDAMEQLNSAIELLSSIGIHYKPVLIEPKKGTKKKSRRTISDKPCSVCEFKTSPPHDARHHRSQGDHKQAFTDDELQERGLVRVESDVSSDPIEVPTTFPTLQ